MTIPKSFTYAAMATLTLSSWNLFALKRSVDSKISADKQGSLLQRAAEVAQAKMQVHCIRDVYTAQRHSNTVRYLSSEEYALSLYAQQKQLQEQRKQQLPSLSAYFATILQNKTADDLHPFVFALQKEEGPASEESSFEYAGNTAALHNPAARKDIVSGNYVRCQAQRNGFYVHSDSDHAQDVAQSDVLITGTKDCTTCHDLFESMLKETAILAAHSKIPLNPKHPYGAVPILHSFDPQEKETLGTMQERTKEAIRLNQFTFCNMIHTDKLTPVASFSAVIVGEERDKICAYLLLNTLVEKIEERERKEQSEALSHMKSPQVLILPNRKRKGSLLSSLHFNADEEKK